MAQSSARCRRVPDSGHHPGAGAGHRPVHVARHHHNPQPGDQRHHASSSTTGAPSGSQRRFENRWRTIVLGGGTDHRRILMPIGWPRQGPDWAPLPRQVLIPAGPANDLVPHIRRGGACTIDEVRPSRVKPPTHGHKGPLAARCPGAKDDVSDVADSDRSNPISTTSASVERRAV